MWCARCQTDVAVEVSADGQSLLCTGCGEEIRRVVAPSLHPDTRSARELLERWSSEELLHPDPPPRRDHDERDERPADPPPRPAEPTASPRETKRADQPPPSRDTRDEPPRRRRRQLKFRIDPAHDHGLESGSRQPSSRPRSRVVLAEELPDGMRSHRAHDDVPPPHFPVRKPSRAGHEPGRSEAFWGQLLAYGGVAVLTVGTCMVLLGYFGGQPTYAPTGWLVTTAGQMLLFLGVVTLVSGGMQQTAHEVARRVEYLNGRMVRIENCTQQLLKGPQYARHRDRQSESTDDDSEASYT